jgi:hypothetical protein
MRPTDYTPGRDYGFGRWRSTPVQKRKYREYLFLALDWWHTYWAQRTSARPHKSTGKQYEVRTKDLS